MRTKRFQQSRNQRKLVAFKSYGGLCQYGQTGLFSLKYYSLFLSFLDFSSGGFNALSGQELWCVWTHTETKPLFFFHQISCRLSDRQDCKQSSLLELTVTCTANICQASSIFCPRRPVPRLRAFPCTLN